MITVVSGLARSGTSMMMQMLEAGGMECVYNNDFFEPNIHNPKGYYEIHKAFERMYEKDFVESLNGKAIKLIGAALQFIPGRYYEDIRVIWMDRKIESILDSIAKMTTVEVPHWMTEVKFDRENSRRSLGDDRTMSERIMKIFGGGFIVISYERTVEHPRSTALDVAEWLGEPKFNVDSAAKAVDPTLWRNR